MSITVKSQINASQHMYVDTRTNKSLLIRKKEVLVCRNNKKRGALLSNWGQTDYLFKLKQDCLWSEAGHAISELCAGRATKNVFMDCLAEPMAIHWDGASANE